MSVSPNPEPIIVDPTDSHSWGTAVDRAACALADKIWGSECWYRGAANEALAAALGLDPKDTWRVLLDHETGGP